MSKDSAMGEVDGTRVPLVVAVAAALVLRGLPAVRAQTPTPSGTSVGAPLPGGGVGTAGGTAGLSSWFKDITFSAQLQGGVMSNPRPGSGERNFGQLTIDH